MFTVKEVINGEELIVEPNWLWEGQEGNKVVVYGYSTPKSQMPGFEFAKSKLEALVKGKEIELFNPRFFQKRYGDERLVCSVYLDEVDIANYFPEFKGSRRIQETLF